MVKWGGPPNDAFRGPTVTLPILAVNRPALSQPPGALLTQPSSPPLFVELKVFEELKEFGRANGPPQWSAIGPYGIGGYPMELLSFLPASRQG